jgi:hypothetical protein
LNAALGDPVGRVRAAYGLGDLALLAYLSPVVSDRAESALAARFGPISQEEMAEKAAASGYELRCHAWETGRIDCQ